MAVDTLAMSSNATFHPFFTKPTEVVPTQSKPEEDENDTTSSTSHKREKSKPKNDAVKVNGKCQTTLGHLFKQDVPLQSPLEQERFDTLQNDDRRKRRRTSMEEAVNVGAEQQSGEQSIQLPEFSIPQEHDSTPKKMLKLKANGKFKSPVQSKERDASDTVVEAKRRGRPRKSKESKETQPPKQLIVCMRFGTGQDSVGHKIDAILRGELTVELPKPTPKKIRTPRKPKSTHPFFAEKAKQKKVMTIASPRRTAASTPGKLRVKAAGERGLHFDDIAPIWESTLLKDRLMIKHPGAKEPLWPAKGMQVRDCRITSLMPDLPHRKRKHALPYVHDSLLLQCTRQLQPEPEPIERADGFREPRYDLRIPEKLLMSGADVATTVARELVAPLLYGEPDELAPESSQATIHPALHHIYHSIPSYLSGFDHIRGEQLSWTQRSSPQAADHILQPVKEMQILKTWLQSMAVNSVESKHERMSSDAPRRKKRKTRPAELDNFIVDEDDDLRGMDTINEEAPGSQSMVQSQLVGVRPSNTVLISGPHGCGKTAAVYAIAKELQYRVFEISSAERRSGKDVLDKIGNVTENHIVKRHNADSEAELSGTEDKERIDTAFKEDLESGRQGKMSAFFKPTSKPAIKKPSIKAQVVQNLKTAIKKAAKEQQQSLILLEEADILFKEDKEFWTTILRLVQTSKRPFIITCNDEDLVPIQALQFHAVLRLIPPPDDLAIDYLLLVAAKEGHLLRRTAIAAMWRDCQHDLRRALTTLDFWCRMGVGDIRGGLDWIYQRWPIGSDLDSKGRPLRVISRGTFLAGMGTDTDLKIIKQPIDDLKTFSAAADYLSSIDTFSTVPQMDTSIPPLPQKQRSNYIEGLTLLDAPLRVDYTLLQDQIVNTALQYARLDKHSTLKALDRQAFTALDILAYPITVSGMEESVLDGPFKNIVTDIAPFVRQVVRYEAILREHREAISGPIKRARTTRVARSALEGGQRQLTRREEWWEGSGSMLEVLSTAGRGWGEPLRELSASSDEM